MNPVIFGHFHQRPWKMQRPTKARQRYGKSSVGIYCRWNHQTGWQWPPKGSMSCNGLDTCHVSMRWNRPAHSKAFHQILFEANHEEENQRRLKQTILVESIPVLLQHSLIPSGRSFRRMTFTWVGEVPKISGRSVIQAQIPGFFASALSAKTNFHFQHSIEALWWIFNLPKYRLNIIPQAEFHTPLHCSLGHLHLSGGSLRVVKSGGRVPHYSLEFLWSCRQFTFHVVSTLYNAMHCLPIRRCQTLWNTCGFFCKCKLNLFIGNSLHAIQVLSLETLLFYLKANSWCSRLLLSSESSHSWHYNAQVYACQLLSRCRLQCRHSPPIISRLL